MAGNYPDYPNNRLAYHLDGTQVHYTSLALGGVLYPHSGGTVAALNNEANTVKLFDQDRNEVHRTYFLFPEPRDITHYLYQTISVGDVVDVFQVWTSVDTTNGLDGTWVNTGATGITTGGTSTTHRTGIVPITSAGTGIKGLQFYLDTDFYNAADMGNIHLFGRVSSANDRLDFWDPVLDQRIAPAALDWGNSPRSSSATKTFRVKNQSATLTANSVVISAEDSLPSGAMAAGIDFSTGGGYASTQNIGALAPGAISSVITMRRTWAISQPLGPYVAITKAVPGSWT